MPAPDATPLVDVLKKLQTSCNYSRSDLARIRAASAVEWKSAFDNRNLVINSDMALAAAKVILHSPEGWVWFHPLKSSFAKIVVGESSNALAGYGAVREQCSRSPYLKCFTYSGYSASSRIC